MEVAADPISRFYYNIGIGRFTQEDVIYNDGLNLYAYCSSNSVMYEDPSGYSCETKDGAENSKKGDKNPVFEVSRKKYPNHAKMLENANREGHSPWVEHGSMRMTLPEDLPLRQTRWVIKHPMSMTVSEGNNPASTE